MTLVKSKINSLAWLKSAVYISAIGGVFLSCKPAVSATLTVPTVNQLKLLTMVIEDTYGGGLDSVEERAPFWEASIKIYEEESGTIGFDDVLRLVVTIQHKAAGHPGDADAGLPLGFDFRVNAGSTTLFKQIFSEGDLDKHLPNHSDTANGKLTVNFAHENFGRDKITDWKLELEANHNSYPVPEPTTIFGSAIFLGVGGWLKRKKSSQQDKTAPQR